MRGLAAKTGVWFTGIPFDKTPSVKYRVMWCEGCFDDFFRRLKSGKPDRFGDRERVGLWLAHESDSELCSTEDGSLRVWLSAEGEIRFRVDPSNGYGRRAIGLARRMTRYRQVSLGVHFLDRNTSKGHDCNVMSVFEASIYEISLVPRGAFPGTYLVVK